MKRRRLKKEVISITIGTILTIIMGTQIIPSAYAQRGYFAIGGEWIALVALWWGFIVAVDAMVTLARHEY